MLKIMSFKNPFDNFEENDNNLTTSSKGFMLNFSIGTTSTCGCTFCHKCDCNKCDHCCGKRPTSPKLEDIKPPPAPPTPSPQPSKPVCKPSSPSQSEITPVCQRPQPSRCDLDVDILENEIDVFDNLNVDDELFHIVCDLYRGLKFEYKNMALLLVRIIEEIHKNCRFNHFNDVCRKKLAIDTLLKILKTVLDVNDKEYEYAKLILPTYYDLIYIAHKGKLEPHYYNYNKDVCNYGSIVDSYVAKILTLIQRNKYKTTDVITKLPVISLSILKSMEDNKSITEMEKKIIVLETMRKVVFNNLYKICHIDNTQIEYLVLSYKCLSCIIDVVFNADRGQYDLSETFKRKVKRKFTICSFKLFNCCRSK